MVKPDSFKPERSQDFSGVFLKLYANWYSLAKNLLTNGANNYCAVIQSMDTVNLEQVIEWMIAHGCILSQADAESTINHFFDSVESYLLDGFRVNTREINFAVSIKGNFNSKTDSFAPSRHTIEAVTSPGAQFRRITHMHTRAEGPGWTGAARTAEIHRLEQRRA